MFALLFCSTAAPPAARREVDHTPQQLVPCLLLAALQRSL